MSSPGSSSTAHSTEQDGIARRVLGRYGHADASITWVGQSDTTVYRVHTPSGEHLALRLHTAARHGRQALASELRWLDQLARVARLPVPQPQPVRREPDVWVMEERTGEGMVLLCTLLSWLDGEALPGAFSPEQAGQAGELLAHLHTHSSDFLPPGDFERPRYDAPYFLACWADLRRSLGPEHLTAERSAALSADLERLAASLGRMEAVPGGFGLIHADAHPGNFLQSEGGLRLLDFDRCGWGPFLLDVAGATLDLEVPEREVFLAAYTRVRPLPPGHEAPLRALKVLAAVENLAFLARRPHELPFVVEALDVVEAMMASPDHASPPR
ncbi:phosphotransferase enzyme family protein [Deinococcus apachensis]|uniref:phosphotransferase enzyme family protein n=1 Tax=Deinococcus apachensis TaxID=309886 RepID=UPI00037E29B4|nr:phosphotransferase [Deinococcus apachensis]